MTNIIEWDRDQMVEITLTHPDDFLILKETLTRIGVSSHRTNTLYQSCHILHKQGRYYIVHFKEMFLLDGKECNLSLSDILRRNSIIKLVESWGRCRVKNPDLITQCEDIHNIKIIKFSDKNSWELKPKYTIGN